MLEAVLVPALAAAVLFLLAELYRRSFLAFGDEDTVATYLAAPLWNRPDFKRLQQRLLVDADWVKKAGGKRVLRFVHPLVPTRRVILCCDANLSREIYVGNSWTKFERPLPYQEAVMPIAQTVAMPNDAKWREIRYFFDRTFSTAAIRQCTPLLNDLRNVFMDQIATNRGAEFDIQPYVSRLTFDVISRLSFGENLNVQTTQQGKQLMSTWEHLLASIMTAASLDLLLFPGAWKKVSKKLVAAWQGSLDVINGMIDANIARHRNHDDGRTSILDDSLRSEKLPESLKDMEEFRKHMATLLFAGHDTTAGTTAMAIHFLAENPEWQKRIRDEVAGKGGGPDVFLLPETLEQLPVLNAVIKETLRLMPAAPHGAGRTMAEDMDFRYKDDSGRENRIVLRKGDVVVDFIYGRQRHPDYWPRDADAFDPTRFLEDASGGAKHLYAYGPFGNGARRCLGERLALAEMRMVLSALCSKYDVVRGNYVFEPLQTGAISAKNGVWVKLVEVKA
ncbi:cytochrome P450 [Hyaloraphidium curvatum]|nr:cytochrome P450 [Hyaloraphidium curvatum]